MFGLTVVALGLVSFIHSSRDRPEANLRRLETDPVPGDIAAVLPSSQAIPIRPQAPEVRI